MEWVVFAIVAACAVGTAVGLVVRPNPLHGALFLVGNLFCVAVLYLMLQAEFLALAQVIAHLAPSTPFASTPVLDPTTVVAVTTALVLVGVVAGVAPAWRAAQVPPAEALRGQ